jgi:mono/diheme cytochrome c family protein
MGGPSRKRAAKGSGLARLKGKAPGALVLAVVVAGLVVVAGRLFGPSADSLPIDVAVPTLTANAERGRVAFERSCAACHGTNAAGSDKGPPLVHDIYNPGHHADPAFLLAARRGVPQHHWRFGNMPPQPEVTDPEIADIVRYVRELQRANGIEARPHRM